MEWTGECEHWQQQESLVGYVLTHSSGHDNKQKMSTKKVQSSLPLSFHCNTQLQRVGMHRGHYYSALARWNYFIDLLSRISLNSNWCQYSWFFGTTIKILFSSSLVQYGGCWIHSWFSLYRMWCAQTIIYRCREMGMKHRMDVWLLGNSQILKYWSRKSIQILSYFKITFLTFYTISQMGKHWFLCRSLHEVRVAFEG